MKVAPFGRAHDPPESRTKSFFDYWRRRHAFIARLDLAEHSHEANVLIWAALDALSNLWAKQLGRERVRSSASRHTFDAFLARYCGGPFELVSLPDVWHRAGCHPEGLPAEARAFCKTIDRRTPGPTDIHLREVAEDQDLGSLHARVVAACGIRDPVPLLSWLTASRYGFIAYKRMRSSYIHEGRPGRDTHSFQLYDSATAPTYLSRVFDSPGVIGFAPTFMLSVLGRCIDAFEAEALALKRDPVPPR